MATMSRERFADISGFGEEPGTRLVPTTVAPHGALVERPAIDWPEPFIPDNDPPPDKEPRWVKVISFLIVIVGGVAWDWAVLHFHWFGV